MISRALNELSQRHERELRFYEEYAVRSASTEICFDPVVSNEKRPWNSYWSVIDLAKQHFTGGNQKLLDFGCGPADFSLLYGKIGYEVFGFDLSPNNIALAEARARRYKLEDRTHFSVGIAEALDYPDDYFDIIVGIDILHHVEVSKAVRECSRVLKKGGVAIFHEPVRVPIFDRLRETAICMRLAPKTRSLDSHMTEDERKLNRSDIECIKGLGESLSVRQFFLTSRLGRIIKINGSDRPRILEKVDRALIDRLPFLGNFGGILVIKLTR